MFCAESFAQVNAAAVRGSVGDPAHAVIPGAQIKYVNWPLANVPKPEHTGPKWPGQMLTRAG